VTEDLLAIQQLSAKYALAVDQGRFEDWLATWDENGVFEGAAGKFEGAVGLKKLIPILAVRARGKKHVITNLVTEVTGNQASQTCYMLITDNEKQPVILGTATYFDQLIKNKNLWQFVSRKIEFDQNYLNKK
jgi:3-phenylpropionate/cinnamic acid dioxygenase small subunit